MEAPRKAYYSFWVDSRNHLRELTKAVYLLDRWNSFQKHLSTLIVYFVPGSTVGIQMTSESKINFRSVWWISFWLLVLYDRSFGSLSGCYVDHELILPSEYLRFQYRCPQTGRQGVQSRRESTVGFHRRLEAMGRRTTNPKPCLLYCPRNPLRSENDKTINNTSIR